MNPEIRFSIPDPRPLSREPTSAEVMELLAVRALSVGFEKEESYNEKTTKRKSER